MRRCIGITKNWNRCNRSGDWRLFCTEHKKQPLIGIFILIFTVGTGLVTYYDFFDTIFKSMQTSTGSQSSKPKANVQDQDKEGGNMVKQGRDLGKLVMEFTNGQEALIEIAPVLRGQLTPGNLLKSAAYAVFETKYSEISGNKTGILFRVLCRNFYLESGFTKTHMYLNKGC